VGRSRFDSSRVARLPGGSLDGLDRELAQPVSLDFGPALELVGARDVEAVEKRPGVELRRALEVTRRFGLKELGKITAEPERIDQKLGRSRPDQLVIQIALEAVEGLGERVARLGLGGVGPEQQEQPVAADPVIACGSDRREQAEAAGTGTTDAVVITLQPEPAERPKSEQKGSTLMRA